MQDGFYGLSVWGTGSTISIAVGMLYTYIFCNIQYYCVKYVHKLSPQNHYWCSQLQKIFALVFIYADKYFNTYAASCHKVCLKKADLFKNSALYCKNKVIDLWFHFKYNNVK